MTSRARTDWPAVVCAIALGVLAASYIGKLPPALPLMQREFGLELRQAGWVVAMFSALAMATGLFFGLAADRFGPFRMAVAGLVLLILGTYVGATASGGDALLASRFLEGTGFIAVTLSAPSLIGVACAASDLRKALGFWAIYMPLGGSLAMVLAPPVLAASGWRALWWIGALFTAVLAVALAGLRERYRVASAPTRRFTDLIAPLRRAATWLFAAAFVFYAVQFFAVTVWLPTFLTSERGVSVGTASVLTGLVVFANVPGNLMATWLMQRHQVRRSALTIAAHLSMGGCALAIFAGALPDWSRYAGCIGLSFLGGMLPTAALSSAQVLARTAVQIGGIQGLMVQASNLAQFAGAPLIAAVVAASGWDAALPVMLACALAGAGCGAAIRRTGI